MDNVALVYTQVTNLMRQLQSDKIPAPKYIDFVPFALSVGDPELEKLTEGRLMALDQETIPNYLRTRPERDVEAYLKDGLPKLQTNPENLQRNIAHMNKAIGQISETIAAAKASSKQRESATGDLVVNWSKQQETNLLLAAINGGVGISAASIAAQQQAQQQQQQVPVVPQAQIQQGQGARLNINIR